MGLLSAMQTALSGISAASLSVQVAGNNLANLHTVGFKQSKPRFATQTPTTLGLGSSRGNPTQIGNGVMLSSMSLDFSQGAIVPSGDSLHLALEGDGFFILQTSGGERIVTRDGAFHLDADGTLVSGRGEQVLGFGVDEDFVVAPGELQPLQVPVGRDIPAENGAPVRLTGVSIDWAGRIRGRFSDGGQRDLGQIQIARFANPGGLEQLGQNRWAAGPSSGGPFINAPGSNGAAPVRAGATELSNTDVGQNLVALVLSSTQYRANLAVLNTAAELLEELANLRR